MSKEYHVFTNQQPNHEQAFVFEVERDTEHDFVQLKELWIVTTQRSGEVKTRVMLENMIHSIVETEGGNVDDHSVDTILDVFSEVLGPAKTKEVSLEIDDKILRNHSVEDILFAADFAELSHPTEDITTMVNNLLSKK